MEELLKRREERGSDTEKDSEERQRLARWEMSYAQYYDYVVTNEDATVASNDVMEIIRMERTRRRSDEPSG
jgi:guanylate kinase